MKVNDKKIDIDLKCEEKSVKILEMAKEKLMTNELHILLPMLQIWIEL